VNTDLGLRFPGHCQMMPFGALIQAPADMRAGMSAGIVEALDIVTQQLRFHSLAFDADHSRLLDRQAYRLLHVAPEIIENIARHEDERSIHLAVVSLSEQKAGREMIPTARRIRESILRHDRILAEAIRQIRAMARRDSQLLRLPQQSLPELNAAPDVLSWEQGAQHVEGLVYKQHSRACSRDLVLLGGEQQSHQIDDEIGPLQRLDGDSIAGEGRAANLDQGAHTQPLREVDLQAMGAKRSGCDQKGMRIVGPYLAFRQHCNALAAFDLTELELLRE
jgi:hypothetical protein